MIENGSATANQLRTFLEENKVDLGQLINNLVTTGEVTGKHLDGTEMILVVYPYVVAGGYTVVDKDSTTGLYDAHFGLILQQDPKVCKAGYNTRQRDPNTDRGDLPMNDRRPLHRAAPARATPAVRRTPRAGPGPSYRAPVVGSYDRDTGKLTYTDTNPSGDVTYTGGAARADGRGLLEVAADAAAVRAGVNSLTDHTPRTPTTGAPDDEPRTCRPCCAGGRRVPDPGGGARRRRARPRGHHPAADAPRPVQTDETARSAVVRAAERFSVQVNNYDVASVDDYQATVTPLLSPKFKGEFEKAMTDIVASVKQAKMTSKGQVLTSAVASLDPDSAKVLVVSDATVKTVFDSRARHFRWEVSLVKIDGAWLVDDFTPVA